MRPPFQPVQLMLAGMFLMLLLAPLSDVRAQAIDLGQPGFDETYGFGLIAPVE